MCADRTRGQFIAQIPEERYNVLYKRYADFLKVLKDADVPPVRIFDDLRKKQVEELNLIREVSAELQEKKVKDVLKMNLAKQMDPEEPLNKESATDEER